MSDELERSARERLEAPRIEAALAPLRPDPDAFRAGVVERLAGRAGEEPLASAAVPRTWPTWARRAAAVLPPGVAETLFVSKWSATGGSSAAWIAVAAVPWVVLFVAAVLLFSLGRKRVTTALKRELAPRERWAVDSSSVAAAMAVVTAVTIGLAIAGRRGAAVALVVLVALVVIAAVVTGRGGDRARRDQLGAALSTLLAQAAFLGSLFVNIDGDLTSSWTSSLLPTTLGVGSVLVGAACASAGLRRMLMRVGLVYTAVAACIAVARPWMAGQPFPAEPAAVRAFAESFEAPVDDLTRWTQLGTAALSLESIGERGGVSTASAARAWSTGVDDAEDVHPVSALAAVRAGLLDARDVPGAERRAQWFLQRLDMGRRTTAAFEGADQGDVLDTLWLVESGRVDESMRARLVDELDASWPFPGAFRALDHLVHAVEIADALGASDLSARRAPDVRAALAAAWTGRGGGIDPVGFEVNHDGSRRYSERIRSDVDESLWAVLLMARFGVPESIDLRRLDAYLEAESRRGPYAVMAAQARMVIRDAIGLPPASALDVARQDWPLFAGLLAVALAVAAIRRGSRSERPS